MSSLRSMLHLAWMRLAEQPMRSAGLAATLAVAVLSWAVLAAFASPFLASSAGRAIHAILNVVNARVNGDFIPLRYIRRIENIPGIQEINYLTLAAIVCSDQRTGLGVLAMGGSGITSDMQRRGVNAAEIARWNDTRNGLLVNADVAQQCGLTPGMLLSPRDIISGLEMPFFIVGIIPRHPDHPNEKNAYGHYDYVNQLLPKPLQDQVRAMDVIGIDPTRLPQLAEAIEREFASDDPPLEAIVSSDTNSALERYDQVQSLLGVVMGAMAACALLVFLTVLAHQVARRRASMATLQTLGFARGLQFAAIVLELVFIVAAASVFGLLAGQAILIALTPQVFWMTGQLRIPDWALWSLAAALLLLVMLTLISPALHISRLKPIDHLRV